jgi:hypothetical protein
MLIMEGWLWFYLKILLNSFNTRSYINLDEINLFITHTVIGHYLNKFRFIFVIVPWGKNVIFHFCLLCLLVPMKGDQHIDVKIQNLFKNIVLFECVLNLLFNVFLSFSYKMVIISVNEIKITLQRLAMNIAILTNPYLSPIFI